MSRKKKESRILIELAPKTSTTLNKRSKSDWEEPLWTCQKSQHLHLGRLFSHFALFFFFFFFFFFRSVFPLYLIETSRSLKRLSSPPPLPLPSSVVVGRRKRKKKRRENVLIAIRSLSHSARSNEQCADKTLPSFYAYRTRDVSARLKTNFANGSPFPSPPPFFLLLYSTIHERNEDE